MNKTNTFTAGLTKTTNTKGGVYHSTTLSANIDLFALSGRHNSEQDVNALFERAYIEDKVMFVKNVLNLLDIRNGKGERKLFKQALNFLASKGDEAADMIIHNTGQLGRWDYILEGLKHDSTKDLVSNIIREQINADLASARNGGTVSLLAKWLPSINTSSKDKVALAKQICKMNKITQKQYRWSLTELRKHIGIIETKLVNKDYSEVDYSKVPSKAMVKYNKAFHKNDNDKFVAFKEALSKGDVKVNASVLTPGELVAKSHDMDSKLVDGLWANMKDIPTPEGKNILPLVDVSGSMGRYCRNMSPDEPIANSLGLGLYLAERNTGAFKDIFMTFSSKPQLVHVTGDSVTGKLRQMSRSDWGYNTNINSVFATVLDATLKADKADLPSHIVIISDMEFDEADRGSKTNFETWADDYAKHDLVLPKIIFWNVAGRTGGYPATTFTDNVAMVSGYSTNVAANLFNLEKFTPENVMLDTLAKYDGFIAEIEWN